MYLCYCSIDSFCLVKCLLELFDLVHGNSHLNLSVIFVLLSFNNYSL